MIPDAKFLVDDHGNAAAGPELASTAIGVGAALSTRGEMGELFG
jgi:hypothetical protein